MVQLATPHGVPVRTQIGTSDVPAPKSEPFWVERIEQSARTDEWLDAASVDLEGAALSWPSPFNVTRDDIRKHLSRAENLAIIRSANRIIGFVGAMSARTLGRTGVSCRYIDGTIVHRNIGAKQKFNDLMDRLGVRADVEVLHTQSPCMAKALAARSRAIFPAANCGVALSRALRADLDDLFGEIGRQSKYCPVTGIAPAFYGNCLYGKWPIPGVSFDGSFRYLVGDSGSGVVVVGFADISEADRHLVPTVIEGGRA